MQMEGVRAAPNTARDGQFNSGVGREAVDAAFRQEVVGVERSVQDLQQHGNGRRLESCTIDEELRVVLEV